VIVIWVVVVMAVVVLACAALATGLAWGIGEISSRRQQRRQPDFRERKRIGRGRSE
jgi:hypothetical protein